MPNEERAYIYANKKTNEMFKLNETVEEMLKNTHSEEINYYIIVNIRAYLDGLNEGIEIGRNAKNEK